MKIEDLKLTEEDLHNLYDTLDIAQMSKFFNDTMKLNKMDKWLNEFFMRLDKVVIEDLRDNGEFISEEDAKKRLGV